MKRFLSLLLLIQTTVSLHALVINEVMSNPIGDDGGREWIEVYNNTESDIDIASLTISIKGASFIPVTPVAGGTIITSHGYGIIGSTVSGTTRFMQDYGTYSGLLFRSAISLVNTGVTSIELKLQGVTIDTLASYTAAKEGSTYSLIGGSFITGAPSPGVENKTVTSEEDTPITTKTTGNQATLPQASPPSADITLYLPTEKVVVAGAPANFSVFSTTRAGKSIDGMGYTWSFGDGGQSTGSSTLYRYLYPGRYIAQVEGTNGLIAGTGRMVVRVVSPDIALSTINNGKYGLYIDITNPSTYDLDISFWKLSIDGALFSFPKNTLLASGVTRFPGSAIGFASTTISSSTLIKLLFQNMDEVIRVLQENNFTKDQYTIPATLPSRYEVSPSRVVSRSVTPIPKKMQKPSTVPFIVASTSTQVILTKRDQKDVRLATWIKTFFAK